MRVLVAAWVGSTNVGDELLFAALHAKLAARGVAVTAPSVDAAATRAGHGVDAFSHLSPAALLRATGDAGAVVLGGGSLVQDVTSPLNLPLHLSRPWAARLRRRPVAGVGLGAGPLAGPLAKRLAAATLGNAVAVSVRDPGSADLLEGLGLPRPVVAADLAFSLPAPTAPPEDRLVVCLRPWAGGPRLVPVALRRSVEETPAWFVAEVATALDAAAEATGLAVHFVAFQADRDGPLHERVAARMRTPTTAAAPDRHAVLDEVARSRVVVAMRYHGAVAATLAGRPVVAIGYAPKVPSLAAELGPGAAGLAWEPRALARLPEAVQEVAPRGTAVVEARERLRAREHGNEAVLDRLFEAAEARQG